jgi:hypothetical protein
MEERTGISRSASYTWKQVVHGFSRYHKYTLGSDVCDEARMPRLCP